MMKRLFTYILLSISCICHAQETHTLTLSQCVDLAKKNAHAIQASQYKLSSTTYDMRSIKSYHMPSISASGMAIYSPATGSYTIEGGMLPVIDISGNPTGSQAYFPGIGLDYEVGFVYNAGLKIEQPLYTGGKIRTGYKMARIGTHMAEENLRATTTDIVMETSKAYASLIKAIQIKQVAIAYHRLLEELMRNVEKAYTAGVKPKNDVLKVQVKLSESSLNLLRAKNAIHIASMNLCHYIGLPLSDSIIVTDSLPPLYDYHVSTTTDISARPEYRLLAQKSLLAKEQISLSRSEALPQIGLVGQYGYLKGLNIGNERLWDDWNFAAGVQINIPLFHFGDHANKIRAAKALYQESLALQKEANELMSLEMTLSKNKMEEASYEISLAETSVKAAEENLRMSKKQYDAGMESLSDHLEAQALWQKSKQTAVEAHFNHYIQHLQYLKSIGKIQ